MRQATINLTEVLRACKSRMEDEIEYPAGGNITGLDKTLIVHDR